MAPQNMSPELAQAIIASAGRLGVAPEHVGTAISFETGGTFSPSLWGGKNKNHLGLIQFGGPEREKYGVHDGQSAVEQMGAVENFLRDRGVKPGMGLADIYSTINAGAPGLYNRSDTANGGTPGTVMDKVRDQMGPHALKARALLGGAGMLSPSASSPTQLASAAPAASPAGAAPVAPAASPAADDGMAASLQAIQQVLAQQQAAQPQPMQFDFSPTPNMLRARRMALAMQKPQDPVI